VNSIAPALSLLRMALKARMAAISAVVSRLMLSVVPKAAGSAHVNQEHDHLLPFFPVAFDERFAHAGRHLPVDALHVVTGGVLANLFELDSRPRKTERYCPAISVLTMRPVLMCTFLIFLMMSAESMGIDFSCYIILIFC
jgi:hypothetical protein